MMIVVSLQQNCKKQHIKKKETNDKDEIKDLLQKRFAAGVAMSACGVIVMASGAYIKDARIVVGGMVFVASGTLLALDDYRKLKGYKYKSVNIDKALEQYKQNAR